MNERLHRLDRLHGDVVLADWAEISSRPGITYDAFHLDLDGALVLAADPSFGAPDAVRALTRR